MVNQWFLVYYWQIIHDKGVYYEASNTLKQLIN